MSVIRTKDTAAVVNAYTKDFPFAFDKKRAFELYRASRAQSAFLGTPTLGTHFPYPHPSMMLAFSPHFLSLARYAAMRRPFYGKS